MSFSRSFPLVVSFAALTLFGFGCKKAQPLAVAPLPSLFASSTPMVGVLPSPRAGTTSAPTPQGAVRKALAPEIGILRQIMRNLEQATSFHAGLAMQTAEGTANGRIAFVRAKGLHGTMHTSSGEFAELALIGDQIFFRSGTSTWDNLTNLPEGEEVKGLFQDALFASEASSTTPFISNSAKIESTTQDPSGCTLYTFTQSISSVKRRYKICVKNSLPTFISSALIDGTDEMKITYSDVNQPVDLESPLDPPKKK
jgi:hypothetical protein